MIMAPYIPFGIGAMAVLTMSMANSGTVSAAWPAISFEFAFTQFAFALLLSDMLHRIYSMGANTLAHASA